MHLQACRKFPSRLVIMYVSIKNDLHDGMIIMMARPTCGVGGFE